MHSIIIQIYL